MTIKMTTKIYTIYTTINKNVENNHSLWNMTIKNMETIWNIPCGLEPLKTILRCKGEAIGGH